MNKIVEISQGELTTLRQYNKIVDATNIVSKADLKGRITYVNDKFVEISGYTRAELIGKQHNIVRDPNLSPAIFKELWETIQSKNVWEGVISNLRKDGSRYTVSASIFPILDEDGETLEYISIRHEITQIIELSQKVEEMNAYNMQQEHIAREKLEAGIINPPQVSL